MNFIGLLAGIFTLFAIGIGFVWVIKLEYYVGACSKRIVLFLGLITMLSTYFISSFILAGTIGIIGGSIIWGATEMQDQEERAQKGQFPVRSEKLCDQLKNNYFFSSKKKRNGAE